MQCTPSSLLVATFVAYENGFSLRFYVKFLALFMALSKGRLCSLPECNVESMTVSKSLMDSYHVS